MLARSSRRRFTTCRTRFSRAMVNIDLRRRRKNSLHVCEGKILSHALLIEISNRSKTKAHSRSSNSRRQRLFKVFWITGKVFQTDVVLRYVANSARHFYFLVEANRLQGIKDKALKQCTCVDTTSSPAHSKHAKHLVRRTELKSLSPTNSRRSCKGTSPVKESASLYE